MDQARDYIHLHESSLPVTLPKGHVGPVTLGHTRQVWWTGRVAIGLRFEPHAGAWRMASSETWIQELMLDGHVERRAEARLPRPNLASRLAAQLRTLTAQLRVPARAG